MTHFWMADFGGSRGKDLDMADLVWRRVTIVDEDGSAGVKVGLESKSVAVGSILKAIALIVT